MAAKAKGNTVTLDAAVIGSEHVGLSKDGIIANVRFNQRIQSKNYSIYIQSVKARDSNNHDIQILSGSKETFKNAVPSAFTLAQNYPNPFNPLTAISYELSAVSNVQLNVFDILGRLVVTLVNQQQVAGYYRVEWDGKNMQQQPVSSGIYFYQLRAVDPASTSGGGFVCIKKMLLMK
jgi:hypothetical protein